MKIRFPSSLSVLLSMWIVFAVDFFLPLQLNHYGILPRTVEGLWHIPLAPFLHGSVQHLIGNSIPLLGLCLIIHLKSRRIFWPLFIAVTLLSGLGTWSVGSHAYHIGASSVVLGLWSYLIADALFTRSLKALLIAGITVFAYGFLIFTVFDMRSHISFAGHLSGFLAGIACAYIAEKIAKKSK